MTRRQPPPRWVPLALQPAATACGAAPAWRCDALLHRAAHYPALFGPALQAAPAHASTASAPGKHYLNLEKMSPRAQAIV